MRRLICAFVIRIWYKKVSSWRDSDGVIYLCNNFLSLALCLENILNRLIVGVQGLILKNQFDSRKFSFFHKTDQKWKYEIQADQMKIFFVVFWEKKSVYILKISAS